MKYTGCVPKDSLQTVTDTKIQKSHIVGGLVMSQVHMEPKDAAVDNFHCLKYQLLFEFRNFLVI